MIERSKFFQETGRHQLLSKRLEVTVQKEMSFFELTLMWTSTSLGKLNQSIKTELYQAAADKMFSTMSET